MLSGITRSNPELRATTTVISSSRQWIRAAGQAARTDVTLRDQYRQEMGDSSRGSRRAGRGTPAPDPIRYIPNCLKRTFEFSRDFILVITYVARGRRRELTSSLHRAPLPEIPVEYLEVLTFLLANFKGARMPVSVKWNKLAYPELSRKFTDWNRDFSYVWEFN